MKGIKHKQKEVMEEGNVEYNKGITLLLDGTSNFPHGTKCLNYNFKP